jgi:SAM-dependent methyltransferase
MHSKSIKQCQICNSKKLNEILDLGYMPPVNNFLSFLKVKKQELFFPTQFFNCDKCKFFQLGSIVNKEIIFPKSYPYTSSTTKILRENFRDLSKKCFSKFPLSKKDLIMDIGSNDGNLLINFKDRMRVVGITPEDVGKLAIKKGIPTILDYFNDKTSERFLKMYGKAKIITATNVFAHIDEPHKLTKNVKKCLTNDGIFIVEIHYATSLIKSLQYDTIYHEHMRYYTLYSLVKLLKKNGLNIFDAEKIPTHGGSLRVYSSKKKISPSERMKKIIINEKMFLNKSNIKKFTQKVHQSKYKLLKLLEKIKSKNKNIYAIGAPSRATTLINFVGLDNYTINYILEKKGSYKINKLMPGTNIPVVDEKIVKKSQPDYLLILSWHISDDLIKIFKKNGFRGKFIVPLPYPKII